MKRDMNLVRDLMLYIEERDTTSFDSAVPSPIVHFTPTQVVEHVRLLIDAGLATGMDVSSFANPAWLDVKLTWQGHDFLELARPETRWKKALATVAQQGAALTIEVLTRVLQQSMMGG